MSLQGRCIALAEGRQLAELSHMLEKEGAVTLCCPMLSILDHPNQVPILTWLHDLVAGKFTHVILLTGEGLRRLVALAERERFATQVIEALSKAKLITRGPKPVQALREYGLTPTQIALAPTTTGVIATLKQEVLVGAEVGLQMYSDSNPPLTDYLVSAGAIVHPVLPYVYAPAADAERVVDLIRKMADGQVDVLVFTSSPQVDRVFEVASEMHLESLFSQGLNRVQIAAVGPVVKEKLLQKKVRVDIAPEQGFVMKNLVQHIKRAFGPI